jgi:hypothetical protein
MQVPFDVRQRMLNDCPQTNKADTLRDFVYVKSAVRPGHEANGWPGHGLMRRPQAPSLSTTSSLAKYRSCFAGNEARNDCFRTEQRARSPFLPSHIENNPAFRLGACEDAPGPV